MTEPTGPNNDLPTIPDWTTKSFWLLFVIPGALVITDLLGFNLLEVLGVTSAEELADKIVLVILLVTSVGGLLARAAPRSRLSFFGKIAGASSTGASSTDDTARSPAVVGLVALGLALALAACGADGTIKRPIEMTPRERCQNAELALALMEANGVGPVTLERGRRNVELLCDGLEGERSDV